MVIEWMGHPDAATGLDVRCPGEFETRFVAGGLVLTGLTAAALTDPCTMGRLLSALPYNRGTDVDAEQLLQLSTAKSVAWS